jgi:hypothetical protein
MGKRSKLFLALLLAFVTCLGSLESVTAAVGSSLLGDGTTMDVYLSLEYGTSGMLPVPSGISYSGASYLYNDGNYIGTVSYYITVGEGSAAYDDDDDFTYIQTQYQTQTLTIIYGEKGTLAGPTDVSYASSTFAEDYYWDSLLTLDDKGNYTTKGTGTTTVTGTFYDTSGHRVAEVSYKITVKADLTGVTLNKYSQTKYIEKDSYSYASYEFKLKAGTYALPTSSDDYTFTCKSSNSSVEVYGYMEDNAKFVLNTYGSGKTTVTVTINGTKFKVKLKTVEVSINKTSLLLATNKTGKLTVKGVSSGVKWSSTNPKVVKVSANGKVTAKKSGNAVIKAKIGDITVGCVVSVASQSRIKAAKWATRTAASSTYSQAKRMQDGYYDCSSLVWRGYRAAGVYIGGSTSTAPTAANLGKWYADKKKTIKNGLSDKNVQSMKLNVGDLMFETGANNGRYKGIYHVEMITGYNCIGFDSEGNPELILTWASRSDGAYGYYSGYIVGRP